MFETYFIRRKIKRYAKKLPLELRSQFGKKKYYSKVLVDTAITYPKVCELVNGLGWRSYYSINTFRIQVSLYGTLSMVQKAFLSFLHTYL